MTKKIFFWLGNDYTHYSLAYALQKEYDHKLFAIIEVTEKPAEFFKTQKLVNFEKKWFFHDNIKKEFHKPDMEYLSRFEEKYKLDLWKIVQNERMFLYYKYFYKYSRDQVLGILEQECRFFEKILEENKPDFLFIKLTGFHHQELFYQMCKNSGVKVQILTLAPFGKHCMIMQDLERFDFADEYQTIKSKDRSFKELKELNRKFNLSKQLHDQILTPGTRMSDMIKAGKEYFFNSSSKNAQTHYTYYGRTKFKVFKHYVKDYFLTKLRQSYINKNLETVLPNSEKFVFFPLHVEIERSLLIAAPFYTNQIEVIRSIAKTLPINYKLYVKEHPGQIQRTWRSKSEYEQIMDIPNVVLLHPNVPNERIFEKCELVITIAGSSGFEALFYRKPVITFSNMYYSILPSVKKFENFEKLSRQIKESISEIIDSSDLDKFVSLIERNVLSFDLSDFTRRIKKEFFYDGNLLDISISEEKMKGFLEKNRDILKELASAHEKKISALTNF